MSLESELMAKSRELLNDFKKNRITERELRYRLSCIRLNKRLLKTILKNLETEGRIHNTHRGHIHILKKTEYK